MFSKWVIQLWVVPKAFLLASACQQKYLQCCLGSYQSVKANGSTARHLNRFLQFKTWANGPFWGSIPTQKGDFDEIFLKIRWATSCFGGGVFLTSTACRKFSRYHNTMIWVREMIYMRRATRRIKNHDHTTSQSKVMSPQKFLRSKKKLCRVVL